MPSFWYNKKVYSTTRRVEMLVVLLAAASGNPAVVAAASPLAAPARAHRALAPTLDCNGVLAAVHKALNGKDWTKEVNGRFVGYDVGWQWPDPSIDCCSKEFVRYPRLRQASL